MAQTPQQRRANESYARSEAARRGKAASELKKKEKATKPPINRIWVYLLLFVVCGGLVFELLRVIFGAFGA